MLLQSSINARPLEPQAQVVSALQEISVNFLRGIVATMSVPRHYTEERDNNQLTAHWIARQLRSYGYEVELQGQWDNVIAKSAAAKNAPCILVGAHYDSVPGTPGADDNASAVAAMLGCASVVAKHSMDQSLCFVAFNREEDGFVGSADFVERVVASNHLSVSAAHVLEMVGYCDHAVGSQQLPTGLPIQTPDRGDFLGILANHQSIDIANVILSAAKTYLPEFPVLSLKVLDGMEKMFPVLERSDHVPFWTHGITSAMWTDTAEFRNPHYHQPSDTPDTLDYDFLRNVTQVLVAVVLAKH